MVSKVQIVEILHNLGGIKMIFNRSKRNLDWYKNMILNSKYKLDVNVADKLALNLLNIQNGNKDVYTTPLGKFSSDILSEWDEIFQANSNLINSNLLRVEESNKAKFGPRSVSVGWPLRRESLYDYFHKDKEVNSVKRLICEESNKGNLRPISSENALNYLKLNTNSGLPYYTNKGSIKNRILEDIQNGTNTDYPCVLFTRPKESGIPRNVWGFPVADTLKEMRFYRPVLEYQKLRKWRSALIGPEEVDLAMTGIIDRGVGSSRKLVSIDFSSYDATVSKSVSSAAFGYIKSLFQPKYHEEISSIENRFQTIPIFTPDGVIEGYHGVPSGSTFTNEVDSIAQYLIATSLDFVQIDNMQIQGDDGAYSLSSQYEVDRLLDRFESFGLKLNRDKCNIAEDHLIYLQLLFDPYYRNSSGIIGGIYPTYRALNRICFQERWSSFEDYQMMGKDYYSLRTLSILENCKHHPLFKELVKFVYTKDKYKLEFSEDSLAKFVRMNESGSGSSDIIQNHYGDNPRGITSFESYKILKSM